jgi:hypothetical protein
MRHRAKHLLSPTEHRSRCRPVRLLRWSGTATSAAGRAARTPGGRRSARTAAGNGDMTFCYEGQTR